MPHSLGFNGYARKKRLEVATYYTGQLGGGTYAFPETPCGYDFAITLLDGTVVIVKVKSSRLKTKRPNKFTGFDIFYLEKEWKELREAGFDVKAVMARTKGNFIKTEVMDFPFAV